MTEIFLKITNAGHKKINEYYLNSTPVFEAGSYLELGAGSVSNSDVADDIGTLVDCIYTKTSDDYTGFTIPEPTAERGLVAVFEIPHRLMKSVITEIGFFSPDGILILYGNIFLDYSELEGANVAASTTIEAGLTSIPVGAIDFSINVSNDFQTKEQTQIALNSALDEHNNNIDSHKYLARTNGDSTEVFRVSVPIDEFCAINLGHADKMFQDKKTVINLGDIEGTVTLQYDKLYKANLIGDVTIELLQPQNNDELYNVFFNFTNQEGAHSLNLGTNVKFNNGISPNFKIKNQQRIIFETIDKGETVTAYYAKRGA